MRKSEKGQHPQHLLPSYLPPMPMDHDDEDGDVDGGGVLLARRDTIGAGARGPTQPHHSRAYRKGPLLIWHVKVAPSAFFSCFQWLSVALSGSR